MASKGYRKYLREEKARIRREVIDQKEQDKLIADLSPKTKEQKSPAPKK